MSRYFLLCISIYTLTASEHIVFMETRFSDSVANCEFLSCLHKLELQAMVFSKAFSTFNYKAGAIMVGPRLGQNNKFCVQRSS